MKDIFLLYDTCCFFEIVNLNYFMSQTGCEMIFCSLDGNPVKTTEGYSVNVDMALKDIEKLMYADARAGHQTSGLVTNIRSFTIPGRHFRH